MDAVPANPATNPGEQELDHRETVGSNIVKGEVAAAVEYPSSSFLRC